MPKREITQSVPSLRTADGGNGSDLQSVPQPTYKVTIPGRPASKKNSMKIVRFGKRMSIVQSDAYREYEEKSMLALKNEKIRILGAVHVKCMYWLPNFANWPDLSNVLNSTSDILQKAGIILNDKNIVSYDGSRIMGVDSENPRTEVEITELEGIFEGLSKVEIIETVGFVKKKNGKNVSISKCRCYCGKIFEIETWKINTAKTNSCGCYQKKRASESNKTHGRTKTPEHTCWLGMLRRCNNKNDSRYKHYGGRGITVCERWMKFENFFADMGSKPEGMSIDRIDVNGNYEPGNCKWSTDKEQARNKTNSKFYAIDGEYKTLAEWAEIAGVGQRTMHDRLNKLGWDIKKAVETPVRKQYRKPHVTQD